MGHLRNSLTTAMSITDRLAPKRRGVGIMVGSILVGLVLARFVMISPTAAIIVLSCGIVLSLTLLLRKIEHLIFLWLILTTFVWFILYRFLPPYYQPFVGRGIFWGLLVCAILAWALDNVLSKKEFPPFYNAPLLGTLSFFILWGGIGLFSSLDVFVSLKRLVQIVIGLVASYMFYDYFSRDQNNIKKFFVFISLVITVVSFVTVVVGIRSAIAGIPIYKRISLWFTNPNVLGSMLLACIPILLVVGFDFRPMRQLKFFLVFMVLFSLYLSFNRASWLAIMLALGFLLWRGRIRIPLMAASVLIIFLLGLFLPVVGKPIYKHVIGPYYSGRTEIWQAAWRTAQDYALLGTGMGNSIGTIDKYIDTKWLMHQETHNVYLQIAAEMGFPGMIALMVFYVIFLSSCARIESGLRSPYLKSIVRGTTATFLGLLVYGMFDNFGILNAFSAGEFYVLLPYILMALPFAAKRLEERAATG